jgi:predicted nucleic acid-binding protein
MKPKTPKLLNPRPIYLDICALCRPYDVQEFLRIRMETDAVNLILSNVIRKRYQLIVSPIHFREIADISDAVERIHLRFLLTEIGVRSILDMREVRQRAEDLFNMSFGVADAAHVAYAECAGASFITCDDKLIKRCLSQALAIWCGNPVAFCEMEGLK